MVFDVELSTEEARALVEGHHAITVAQAVFRLEGLGAISCLQGLVTNDVAKMPADGLIWGAFLTPKGMIITDAWIRRDGAAAWLIVPAQAAQEMRGLLARTIPPRLAKVTEVTDAMTLRWLVGAESAIPDGIGLVRPTGVAPFRGLVISSTAGSRPRDGTRPRRHGARPRGSSSAGPPSAARSTTKRCRRRSASTNSAGCGTTRGVTPVRKRSPASTFVAMRTASCVGCSGRAMQNPRRPRSRPRSARSARSGHWGGLGNGRSPWRSFGGKWNQAAW